LVLLLDFLKNTLDWRPGVFCFESALNLSRRFYSVIQSPTADTSVSTWALLEPIPAVMHRGESYREKILCLLLIGVGYVLVRSFIR
jgi:hypothetical protein